MLMQMIIHGLIINKFITAKTSLPALWFRMIAQMIDWMTDVANSVQRDDRRE